MSKDKGLKSYLPNVFPHELPEPLCPAITIRTGRCSFTIIATSVNCRFDPGASLLCGSLYTGGYTLGSFARALTGIFGNFTHDLGHTLIAWLLYRRKPITIHMFF